MEAESGWLVYCGDRASVWEPEKVLEMDDGDYCTAVGMSSRSLSRAPKCG